MGPPGVGKSILAIALAALYEGEAVSLSEALAPFNAILTRSPIWLDDECEALGSREVKTSTFRTVVQSRARTVQPKGRERIPHEGCPRIIVTANSPEDLRFADASGYEAARALADRLSVHVIDSEHERAAKAALETLSDGTAQVDVGAISSHFRSILASVVPREQRFYGAQEDDSAALGLVVASAATKHPQVFEHFAAWFARSPDAPENAFAVSGIVRRGDELICRPTTIADRVLPGDRERLAIVHAALGPFTVGRGARKFEGSDVKVWILDAQRLARAIELDGVAA